MGRQSIFEKPMTPAERQRRHRKKKYLAARRTHDEQSVEEWWASMRIQPGDLVTLDSAEVEPVNSEDVNWLTRL